MSCTQIFPQGNNLGCRILNNVAFDFTLLLTNNNHQSHTSVSIHRNVLLSYSEKLTALCRGENYFRIALIVPNVNHALDLLRALYTNEIRFHSIDQYENVMKTANLFGMFDIVKSLQDAETVDMECDEYDQKMYGQTRTIPVFNVLYEEKDICLNEPSQPTQPRNSVTTSKVVKMFNLRRSTRAKTSSYVNYFQERILVSPL